MRKVIGTALVAAVVALACSGDDGDGGEPPATRSPTLEASPTAQAAACSGTIPVVANSNTGEVRLLRFTGSQVSMSEPVGTSLVHPVLSPDGKRIAYFSVRPTFSLWVANADGSNPVRLAEVSQLHDHNPPVWSPRGDAIAFESERAGSQGTRSDVFVVKADGSGLTNLTASALSADTPSWSPDGARLAFAGRETDSANVYVVNVDGSGARPVTDYKNGIYANSAAWSPDGSVIAYLANASDNVDVFTVRPDGAGGTNVTKSPTPEFVSPVGHLPLEFSPDGKKLAFLSERTGDVEAYVINTDGTGLQRLTNQAGTEFRVEWVAPGCLTFYLSRPSPMGGLPVFAVREDGTGVVELTTLR
jgi:TolB protein